MVSLNLHFHFYIFSPRNNTLHLNLHQYKLVSLPLNFKPVLFSEYARLLHTNWTCCNYLLPLAKKAFITPFSCKCAPLVQYQW